MSARTQVPVPALGSPGQTEDEDVVGLDGEREAALVSSLLAVLCGEQATQRVVNTGSLYS